MRHLLLNTGEGVANDYLLQANDETMRWHSNYPVYAVMLMVNNIPDMNVIRKKTVIWLQRFGLAPIHHPDRRTTGGISCGT